MRRSALPYGARRNATVSIPLPQIWGILMQKSVSDGKLCLEIVCERVYHIFVDGTTCRIRRGDRNSRSKSFAPRSDGFRRITEELPTDANDSRMTPLPVRGAFLLPPVMRFGNERYDKFVFYRRRFYRAHGGGTLPEDKCPSACVGCRSCEKVCPQQIKISEMMKDFAERLKA